MRHLYATILFLVTAMCGNAQFEGLIVNELAEDYVELLVVGKKTCTDSTASVRGWIIDDHNGWFGVDALGSHGNKGHLRISFVSLHWDHVPFGSVILIYNENKRHPNIPPDDYIDINGDNLYVLPATVHLDEDNAKPADGATSFGAYNSHYVAGAQTTWERIRLNPTADAFIVVDPQTPGKPHFAIAWGGFNNGLRATLGKAGGIFKPSASLNSSNFALKNSDHTISGNYISTTEATPGWGNSPENAAWIDAMRGSKKPNLNIIDPGTCAPALVDLTRPEVTLNSSVGISLSYWKDAEGTEPVINPTAVAAGTYYIRATNAFGCEVIKPVIAHINSQPPPPVLAVEDRCDGTSKLSASGLIAGATLRWSNGSESDEITVSAAGSYTAIQHLYGCQSDAATPALASPRVAPTFTVNTPPVICGQTASVTINATGGTPPYAFSFDGGTFTNNATHNNLAAGAHQIQVRDAANCITSSAIELIGSTFTTTVNAPPIPCGQKGSINIEVSGNQPPFEISFDGGNFSGVNVFDNLDAGLYKITVRDNSGCTSELSTILSNLNSPILVNAVPEVNPCTGQAAIHVAASNGIAPYYYSINNKPFSNSPDFTNLAEGTYSVLVKDGSGCMSNPTNVRITIPPEFQMSLRKPEGKLKWGTPVHLQVTGNFPFDIVSWTPTDLFSNQNTNNQSFKADTSVSVTVIGRSALGCLDTVAATILVAPLPDVYIPSAFTPNGDGKNDIFRIIAQAIVEVDFKIYNRWGQLVYASNDISQGWNGYLKGKLQPNDVYVYYVKMKKADGALISRKGTVTLIR